MSKVLVTGGAGFIGSHLVDSLLANNNEITIIDNFSTGTDKNLCHLRNNKNVNVVKADICNLKSIDHSFENIDVVFHLAGLADIVPSIEKPKDYFNSNVLGTLNVIECCKKQLVKKIIYTASGSCYGIPNTYPTNELEKIQPQYPYALTKYLGEELLLHWGKVYKMDVVSLRLFNVYGPRSRTSGTYGAVFGVFLAQKIAKKPFTIVGDGSQTRDFTFVSDVIEAILASWHSSVSNDVINIGSDDTYSVNKIVDLLKGDRVFIPKRPGEPDCTWADISKAKKLLNWKPKISLEEGIQIMLNNIDYWSDAPVWDRDSISKATKNWFKYLSSE
tara:strand:- start:592 stop:1584 length:993 start_codon:yes stop_codon:yes gene_type:complete